MIFARALFSAFSWARCHLSSAALGRLFVGGGLGCSKRTRTVTPIARPFWTAVLIVTFAFEGTRHPTVAPRIGALSWLSLRWAR